MNIRNAFLTLLACLGPATFASAQTYDAATDFSPTRNPHGVWTYGWSATLSGAVTVFQNPFPANGSDLWGDNSIEADNAPSVGYNVSDPSQSYIPTHTIFIHPGPNAQFTHCIFTATATGFYDVQASFTPLSYGGPHGYILQNGTSIGDSILTQGGSFPFSFHAVKLAAGDTIDAAIGVGADGVYYNDLANFTLTVTRVTAPIAPTYDANADFSTTNNPNGVWTYGWSTALSGPLTVYPNSFLANGSMLWGDNSIEANNAPCVGYNISDPSQSYIASHTTFIHPGPSGQFSHCVFTATAAGTYAVEATFTALSYGSPHAYMLLNGTSIGDSILSQGSTTPFSFPALTLAAGDTVDLAIGVGPDGVYYNDLANFTFVISRVPTVPVLATYSAKQGFSSTNNPTGPWTYGWSTALDGPVTVYPLMTVVNGCYHWSDPAIEAAYAPNVGYNPTDPTQIDVPPLSMFEHPGPLGQYSQTLFTVPTSGTYNIDATFSPDSFGGPHAYILHNGVPLGDCILPQGTPHTFSFQSVLLNAGDTVSAAVGVGTNNSYLNDESAFTFTLTQTGTSAGGGTGGGAITIVPGTYTGLITSGTSPVDGLFSARIDKLGHFTLFLNFGGAQFHLKGALNSSGIYSTSVHLKDGSPLAITLTAGAHGSFSLSLQDASVSYTSSASAASTHSLPAPGQYRFTLTPTQVTGTNPAPAGTGYGAMTVAVNGHVSLIGKLGDGTSFSASSLVTSGSLVPLYINPYKSFTGGISGTLTFSDIPGVSDCAGALTWVEPVTSSTTAYLAGFTLSTQFVASAFNSKITGLIHDKISFAASGADLAAPVGTHITLAPPGPADFFFDGHKTGIQFSLAPGSDIFFGNMKDATTGIWRPFAGVLLPKSRTGAGLFFSGSLSGSVDISY